jgi:molecular chaperone HtpG
MSSQYTFQADIKELLQLIVNSLYSNPDIFLRELLSNSSDAIEKQKHYDLQNSVVGEDYKARIYTKDDKLYIEDNGVGMSKEDLQQQLSTIAKSGTKEFIQQFVEKKNEQIGQFGVGFFSVFLVSDRVVVYSKKKDNDTWNRWESDATEHYSIEELGNFENEHLSTHGTMIELHLKDSMKEYLKEDKIRSIVKKHSNFIYYPIVLKTLVEEKVEKEENIEEEVEDVETEEGQVETEEGRVDDENVETKKEETIQKIVWEQLNGEVPLWYQNPKDLAFDDYNKLYKVLKEPYSDCLFYRHFKTEGNLDMRGILYVPSQAPFDFMQQQNKDSRDIKLYVKKVLVLDALDKTMLPDWMGFVSGVIDCPDLPMNVSREVLQQSSLLRSIKNQLKKQTLNMLNDLKEDAEKYKLFYKNFGKNIKLGIHEGEDKLLDYLKFSITNDPEDLSYDLENLVSSKFVEGQNKIYYMIGNTSPLLPIYEKKGYSVIRLNEPIDEFMMQRVTKYKDLEFVNICKEHDVPWKSEQTLTEEDEKFSTWLKECLNDDTIEKINLSDSYLENDIGCVVSSKFGMTGNMERIMKSQPLNDNRTMGFMKGKQIWELNMNHSLVKQLREKYNTTPDEKPASLLKTLYQCCLLTSGYTIENPSEFVQSVVPNLSVV